ncbi:MAG: Fe-S cluster assembly protein SufB [Candidatus Glassbacteria bacterium]|nr:Fe-S cluster assembly protein SufB [Candidatus Glassbacteria bacterium]
MSEEKQILEIDPQSRYKEKWGWRDPETYVFKPKKGLSREVVEEISFMKSEPDWMREFRLKSFGRFERKQMPGWGADLSGIDFQDIFYFLRATDKPGQSWDEVPDSIKNTFDRLGIPEAERKFLAGVSAQYESEVVYHKVQDDLVKKGVIFNDMDSGLREHPEIVKKYLGTVIPPGDNKMAALNSAVWSGGSFIYVPPGVRVEVPLQAYFRINTENMGQFERTLILAEEGSEVHYIEGCTAPVYSSVSLHSAVVELIAMPHARIRYTTIQNWSSNVYNLVTKRAVAGENAVVEWVDGNLGSRVTMKYPSVVLKGRKAHGEVLSLAMAGDGQHQDTGSKMIHAAPETTSLIVSKSISKGSGRTSYRGLVQVLPGAEKCKANVRCDALLIDDNSRSDTYPYMNIAEEDVEIGHEATVARIGDEQLFYLMSRGLNEEQAAAMIVRGFVEPIVKQLPMEYAVELNRLIELQMEGSVG